VQSQTLLERQQKLATLAAGAGIAHENPQSITSLKAAPLHFGKSISSGARRAQGHGHYQRRDFPARTYLQDVLKFCPALRP